MQRLRVAESERPKSYRNRASRHLYRYISVRTSKIGWHWFNRACGVNSYASGMRVICNHLLLENPKLPEYDWHEKRNLISRDFPVLKCVAKDLLYVARGFNLDRSLYIGMAIENLSYRQISLNDRIMDMFVRPVEKYGKNGG